jgi:hypothetical protein
MNNINRLPVSTWVKGGRSEGLDDATFQLKELLLGIAGDKVCLAHGNDPYATKMLDEGYMVFDMNKYQYTSLSDEVRSNFEPSNCHHNALWLNFITSGDLITYTGWAYTASQGMWRQHSWAYDPRHGTVAETTVDRDIYVGVPSDNNFYNNDNERIL